MGCSRSWVVALVLVVAFGNSVVAQTDDATAADKEAAKLHFLDGKKAQDAGDYPRAIRSYRRAYTLVPEPLLLFNLAQVRRLAGERRRALALYRKYLDEDPKGRGAEIARRFEEELSQELDADSSDDVDLDPTGGDGASEHAGDPTGGNEGGSEHGESDGAEATSAGRGLRWAGLGVAAAGAVAIGLGIKYGLDAQRISDDLSQQRDQWTEALLARAAQGESAEKKMFLFTSVGAAAVVTGGVLYYFGRRRMARGEQVVLEVAPNIGVGHASIGLHGWF